jgi:hypothetical protein
MNSGAVGACAEAAGGSEVTITNTHQRRYHCARPRGASSRPRCIVNKRSLTDTDSIVMDKYKMATILRNPFLTHYKDLSGGKITVAPSGKRRNRYPATTNRSLIQFLCS